jgi:hypothetical protein
MGNRSGWSEGGYESGCRRDAADDPSVYRIYWPLCLRAGRAPTGIVGVITIMKQVTAAQLHELIPDLMHAFLYFNNKVLKWILHQVCNAMFIWVLQGEESIFAAD